MNYMRKITKAPLALVGKTQYICMVNEKSFNIFQYVFIYRAARHVFLCLVHFKEQFIVKFCLEISGEYMSEHKENEH